MLIVLSSEIGSILSGVRVEVPASGTVFADLFDVGALSDLLLLDSKSLLSSLLGSVLDVNSDLDLLLDVLSILDDKLLELASKHGGELCAGLSQLLLSLFHQSSMVEGVSSFSTLKVLLGGKLLGVTILDGLLDAGDLLFTVLSTELLHGDLFLFLNGTSPNLDIVDLAGLVKLESVTISLQDNLVVSHDLLVIDLFHSLKVLDSILADGLETTDAELSEDLLGTLLHLDLQAVLSIVDLSHVSGLNLILLELVGTLLLLLHLLVFPVHHLRLSIFGEVLLGVGHSLFDFLDLAHLIVELTLYLLENSDSLSVRSAFRLNFLEDLSELVAEDDKVLVDLGNLVEGGDLLGVISDSDDEAESVALIEETLDLVPVSVEGEHLVERSELHVGEEVLALLDDSDGQSLLNEGLVLFEVRHDLAGLVESFRALLADRKG